MAVFFCPSCGHSTPAKQEHLGKKAKCPSCQKVGVVRPDSAPSFKAAPKIRPSPSPSPSQRNSNSNPFSFLNVRPLLTRLDDADTVYLALSSIWRISVLLYAVVFLLSWLFSWLGIAKMSFSYMPLFLLMQITTLIAAFFATQIMWHRGQDLQNKGVSKQRFVVVPIFAKFISALSEAGAASMIICCIPFAIIAAVSGFSFAPLPNIEDATLRSLVAGFGTALYLAIGAVILLVAGRLISELLNVIFSIANDINHMATPNKEPSPDTESW